MSDLIDMNCTPLRGDDPQATPEEIEEFMSQIPKWEIIEVEGIDRLRRVFAFKNFANALAFTNQIGALAEEQDHHPALLTEWGKVTLTWWTHTILGLHRNDFISAAKTDHQYNELSNY